MEYADDVMPVRKENMMKRTLSKLLALLLTAGMALPIGASPPGGGTNEGATLQAGEPDSIGNGGASVWWKWTAPSSA